MIKRVTLLRRREDLTEQDFRTHWAEPHAKIAKGFEGLLRYNQNRIDEICWRTGSCQFEVGGIVELWFRSEGAVRNNATSETTRALIEDEPKFLSGLTALAAGESWISQSASPGAKYMILISTEAPERLRRSFEEIMRTGGEGGAPSEFYFDSLSPSFTREALWSEPTPPNVAITVWCDNDTAAMIVEGPGSRLARLLTKEAEAAVAYRIDELRIV